MSAPQRHSVLEPATDALTQRWRAEWAIATVVFGLAVVAAWRQGGFWDGEAFVVGLVSLGALLAACAVTHPDRRGGLVLAGLGLLASWWLVRSVSAGTARSFLPLGASVLAFAAAFAAVRGLNGRAREIAGLALAGLGAAVATVGFVGLVWRWYPMAMPSQGLWRLSSTLTYADAAGALLGACLLIALGCGRFPALTRVAVCLTAGGLVATQSRGAYLAFVCAVLLVRRTQVVRFLPPLLAGAILGFVAVATSPLQGASPWLGAALVAAVAFSATSPWALRAVKQASDRTSAPMVAVAAGLVGLVGTVALAHHEIGLRALAPSNQDRLTEWSAALHQWASAPFVGVGPDQVLVFHAVDGDMAHFVHNEYLQVAADSGLLGLGLLGLVAVSLARTLRRFDALSAGAVAAVVCLAVAGAFDFDWHLPVVGLLGGWCAGLAARTGP